MLVLTAKIQTDISLPTCLGSRDEGRKLHLLSQVTSLTEPNVKQGRQKIFIQRNSLFSVNYLPSFGWFFILNFAYIKFFLPLVENKGLPMTVPSFTVLTIGCSVEPTGQPLGEVSSFESSATSTINIVWPLVIAAFGIYVQINCEPQQGHNPRNVLLEARRDGSTAPNT